MLRVKAQEEDPSVNLNQLSKEVPPKYDSQSNGGTEVGVRLVRGLFRTLKLCLEGQIGKFIPVQHPVVPWLLEHTAFLLNVKTRGSDGMTPWARVKGRMFGQATLGFGESVFFKLPTKGPQSQPDGNMGAVQAEATFMGYSRKANTYVLVTDDGRKVEARSVTRRPAQNRWSSEKLASLKITPWSTRDKTEPAVRSQAPTEAVDGRVEVAPPTAPRDFRINAKDLVDHGYSEGCPQCRHIEAVGRPRPGGTHSAACRTRILEAIGQSDAGKQCLSDHEARLDRAMVEYSSPDAAPAVAGGAAGGGPREVLRGSASGEVPMQTEPLQPGRSGLVIVQTSALGA